MSKKYRSSETGRYIGLQEAELNPNTAVGETASDHAKNLRRLENYVDGWREGEPSADPEAIGYLRGLEKALSFFGGK